LRRLGRSRADTKNIAPNPRGLVAVGDRHHGVISWIKLHW